MDIIAINENNDKRSKANEDLDCFGGGSEKSRLECLSDITRLSIQVKITTFGVVTVSIEARTVNVWFYYDLSALEQQTLWGTPRHVLKPETTKRNHRNKRNERNGRNETTETNKNK